MPALGWDDVHRINFAQLVSSHAGVASYVFLRSRENNRMIQRKSFDFPRGWYSSWESWVEKEDQDSQGSFGGHYLACWQLWWLHRGLRRRSVFIGVCCFSRRTKVVENAPGGSQVQPGPQRLWRMSLGTSALAGRLYPGPLDQNHRYPRSHSFRMSVEGHLRRCLVWCEHGTERIWQNSEFGSVYLHPLRKWLLPARTKRFALPDPFCASPRRFGWWFLNEKCQVTYQPTVAICEQTSEAPKGDRGEQLSTTRSKV